MPKIKGFTLIELLMVMGIIAVLVTFFVGVYPSSGKKARDSQRKSDLKQYQTALESYSFANDGEYPPTSGEISTLCTQLKVPSCPDDPKTPTSKYHYKVGASSLSYYLWAELENDNSATKDTIFIVCSEGVAGDKEYDSGDVPASATCPL